MKTKLTTFALCPISNAPYFIILMSHTSRFFLLRESAAALKLHTYFIVFLKEAFQH